MVIFLQKLLTPKFPGTPIFYMLPKIHKPIRPSPGRPIVSSNRNPTETRSVHVDEILQPFVQNLPSLNDSKDTLSKMKQNKQPLPDNSIIVTVDFESLYTNIPHAGGLDSCKHFFNLRPNNTKPSTRLILELITMILTLNNFNFQD